MKRRESRLHCPVESLAGRRDDFVRGLPRLRRMTGRKADMFMKKLNLVRRLPSLSYIGSFGGLTDDRAVGKIDGLVGHSGNDTDDACR